MNDDFIVCYIAPSDAPIVSLSDGGARLEHTSTSKPPRMVNDWGCLKEQACAFALFN